MAEQNSHDMTKDDPGQYDVLSLSLVETLPTHHCHPCACFLPYSGTSTRHATTEYVYIMYLYLLWAATADPGLCRYGI